MRNKILVIDDEEALCEILKFNLEREGYSVDMALSAEEALEMDLKKYDLFIVDIMMERLSGFDFAKMVKDIPEVEETPIIFCSALVGKTTRLWVLTWAVTITSPNLLPPTKFWLAYVPYCVAPWLQIKLAET